MWPKHFLIASIFISQIECIILDEKVPRENIWAVLIAGDRDWENYCMQSSVCRAYHILIKHGVLPEKIIVIADDGVVNNKANPFPGKLFNVPNGTDVYAGVKIDYRGEDANIITYINVLRGNAAGNKGIGTGRVLNSTQDDHVFIYHISHGGHGFVVIFNMLMTKLFFKETLTGMYESKMYKNLLFYMESCHSGSMFENLPAYMGIYAVTASSPKENAWMCYCETFKGTCLSGEFGKSWMYDTETNDILVETIGQQVASVVESVKLAHVSQYGDESFKNKTLSKYQGKEKTADEPEKKLPCFDPVKFSDAALHFYEQTIRQNGANEKDVAIAMKIKYQKRKELSDFLRQTAEAVVPQSRYLFQIMNDFPTITQLACHDAAIKAFDKLCAPFDINPFALQLTNVIANMCEITGDAKSIVKVFTEKCKNSPRFFDVL